MAVRIKERTDSFVHYGDYYVLGPSVARCPNHCKKGYGDVLLMADVFDGSDSAAGTILWRSFDEGGTFEVQEMIEKSYVYDFEDSFVKSGYGALYTDHQAGVLVFIANDTYWEKNEIKSIWKKRTLYYRLSFDNGYTWTDKRYIVQKGLDDRGNSYDRKHFLKDVAFGANMAATVSPRIVRADDDTLLVGVQVQITDERGEIINATGMGYMKCGALKGYWVKERLDYEWELGEYASVSLEESTRGVYEPAFESAGKNSLIMVMRGSNMGRSDRTAGVKFFSVSHDDGLTWTKPSPLKYDDGSTMYSSSCIPKLLKHSSGKLYFIGVINADNPNGNLPRYPLCIAEIDAERCCVLKDTVTAIDTKRANQVENVKGMHVADFTNHGVYEDRKTGDIVVLAPFRSDLSRYRSVLNKYVIEVL